MESHSPVVAVVRSDRRRHAIAEALALINQDVRDVVGPRVVLKPNLVSHRRQLASTHLDAFGATLDALIASGASEVIVAEGASDATEGFRRFGLIGEAWGRPVRFLDLNRDETEWDSIELQALDGAPLKARISRTIVEAPCRVSLALAKTHVCSSVTFSLKNMLSSIHPDDRVMMHGHAGGGNGYRGWRRLVVEFLKGDNPLVNILTRSMGRVKKLKNRLGGLDGPEAFDRLSPSDLSFLKSVVGLNRNLARLSARARPSLSVIDAFEAMHREGPRHGTPIKLGLAIAGTDPVAVDTVATALMGFDPDDIGYLQGAQALGVGVADLDRITIVGDPIHQVRRACVAHSNASIGRHWRRIEEGGTIPRHHLHLRNQTVRQ